MCLLWQLCQLSLCLLRQHYKGYNARAIYFLGGVIVEIIFITFIAFPISFYLFFRILNPISKKLLIPEDESWPDLLREDIVVLLSMICGGLLIIEAAYLGGDDIDVKIAKGVSMVIAGFQLVKTGWVFSCWLDDRFGRMTFRATYFYGAIIILGLYFYDQGEKRDALEKENQIKQDLFHSINSALSKEDLHTLIVAQNWSKFMDTDRYFLTECIQDYILDNFSIENAKRISSIIDSRRFLKKDDSNSLKKNLPADLFPLIQDKPLIQEKISHCQGLLEKLKPEFKQLINAKLFNDLRPHLAKSAKESFYESSIMEGPKTVIKYISLIQLTTNKQQWLETDKKYGRKLKKGIEWQYKVANCEHIVKLGPQGGFGAPVRPDEKILAERKKCREEKNLTTK